MKTLATRIAAAVSLTAIAIGCSTERSVSPTENGPRPINFSAKIDERISTRVSGTEWGNGDAIGIFMFASGDEKPTAESEPAIDGSGTEGGESAPKDPLRSNVRHIYDPAGSFLAANKDEALFYPTTGETVDFAAYYPFTDALTDNKYPIDVRNRIDLLYSNDARAKLDEAAALTFGHVLCRLSLTVSAADATSLDGLKVRISGAATHGTLDLASGELTLEKGDEAIEAEVKTASEGAVSVNAILIPDEDVDLSIHFAFADGEESVLELSGKDLARGYDYGYAISVDESAQAVVVEGSKIEDWQTEDGGELSIGKGAREEFYTETFGSGSYLSQKPLEDFEDWSSGATGVTYLADSQDITIRTLLTPVEARTEPFIYFPTGGGTVSIAGLPVEEWSSVVFSCRVRAFSGTASVGELRFFDGDGGELTPDGLIVGGSWTTVSFPLPANKIVISTASVADFCLDDIALSGLPRKLSE